jgi:Tfp pilus assembly protein PilF
MRLSALVAALVLAMTASMVAADVRTEAKEQVKFGIEVAQHNLWREAISKFERAADIDPSYAAAWNNLAIAHEQQGNLDKAYDAYQKALKLDPDNQYIKQNYDLFREIHERTLRQNSR